MVIKKNILVTGSNGQLGTSLNDIYKSYPFNFYFRSKKQLDITDYGSLEHFLFCKKINIIINCAAYTDVNNAENEHELSENINHFSVENIATLCFKFNIQLIHISTDYVFDGLKKIPYKEVDRTNPINKYGISKLNGEKKILNFNLNKSIIIRTSWLYSNKQNNFVNKIILNLKNQKEVFVVDDEIGSPTNAFDLAKTIMDIIPKLSNQTTEIYHFSNSGFCSRFSFATKINELINGNCRVVPIKQNSKKPLRPKFSALDSTKICNEFSINLVSWEVGLKKYLTKK